MARLAEFKIIPILGRKVDVPVDDATLFRSVGEGVALTHDVGGLNFDLQRKRNACTKSYGYSVWSNSANAQATKCLGLFELYDGANRDHLMFDNGKVYQYDSALDPQDVTGAGVTHATDNIDLYSIIRVGSYAVWADRGETTPYAWKNGDANAAKLISSGTEFKPRYLTYFMRRIIALYNSAQTNADIDIRWSGALPTPTSACTFAAANQLFCPNDDSITGVAQLGFDRCYVVCENSINQLVYYPDYVSPFRIYTVVPNQGFVNHHSLISLGDRMFGFNKNYGFCEYAGGREITPISQDIESDLANMNTAYYNLIVGTYVPLTRQVVWTVPMVGESTPNRLLFYDIDTKQWVWEDKAMRYVDNWLMYANYTWSDLITDLGGTGAVWTTVGTASWAYYISERQRLVYANTDGKLYYHTSEGLNTAALDSYRIEPAMQFGDSRSNLQEIWFDVVEGGVFSIDVNYRGGNTIKELEEASWTALDSVSLDNPAYPVCRLNQHNRYHQIKWGTDAASEKYIVNGITLKYTPEGDV